RARVGGAAAFCTKGKTTHGPTRTRAAASRSGRGPPGRSPGRGRFAPLGDGPPRRRTGPSSHLSGGGVQWAAVPDRKPAGRRGADRAGGLTDPPAGGRVVLPRTLAVAGPARHSRRGLSR